MTIPHGGQSRLRMPDLYAARRGVSGVIDLGIITPVVTLLPGAHARWERTGTIHDVVAIARAADALGYHHLTCSEHVAVPVAVAATRGARYWDPLATLGYLAAVTERIRLMPSVVVLGYHHPLAIVKRYGTLDQVSRGRLVLGVGVGSLVEEFELLGAPFDDRGARADEALRAIRASLSTERSSFSGSYFEWEDMLVEPTAVQEHVPIWVGGRTARSLRRAVELADGWAPFGLDADEVADLLARSRATDAWSRRDRPLDLVLQNQRAFDPTGQPDATADAVAAWCDAGATGLALRFVHHSVDHYIEQMEAMVGVVVSVTGSR
jgi:probable F420-dependent oxidoreductase